MPAPLWQYADYLQYANHPSSLVREWALDGLEYHYPEQGLPVALKLLGDSEEEVFQKAALYLAEHATEQECPFLLDAFLARKTRAAPVYLKALSRAGYVQAVPLLAERLAVSQDKNEMLVLGEVLGSLGGPLAREALRRLLAQVKTEPVLWPGVAGSLARLGQPADFRQIAADYFDRQKTIAAPYDHRGLADIAGVRELAKTLAEIWPGRGKKRQELLACATAYFGPDFPAGWFSSEDMAPLWRQVTRASRLDALTGAVLEAARQIIKSRQRDENALAAAAALSGEKNPYRQLAGLRWLLLASLHQEAQENNLRQVPEETAGILLACLFALAAEQNYGEIPATTPPAEREQRLLELLGSPRPEVSPAVLEEVIGLGGRVVKELTDVLVRAPASWGALRAVRALRQLARRQPEACLPAAPALLALLASDAALGLMDDCTDALAALGPAVLPLIDRVFQKNPRPGAEFHLLSILGRLPYPETVEILARQEKLLFEATELYCLAVRNLGSASFLDLYRREWRPGEFLLTETLLFLAELHGQQIPELSRLRREYREHRQKQRKRLAALSLALEEGTLPDRDAEGPFLELKCRRCGRVYHYQVDELFVNVTQYKQKGGPRNLRDALLIKSDIVCKGCGAVNDYEYTNAALLAVTAEMMLLAARGEKASSWLSFGKSVTFDGKEIPLSKMPAHFARLVERSPADAALRIRYGNVLRRLGRIEEALAQYQTAVQLEPGNAEAAYALGTLYESLGQQKKAAPLLARGEAFLAGQLAAAEPAAKDLWDDPPEKAAAAPVRVVKIGRNQPCPCGSGKKYKHCCGQR